MLWYYKIMYNTKIICTYNRNDIFLDSDNISEYEKEFIREVIYRQELLDILGLDSFNEIEMNDVLNDMYNRIKDCNEIKECIKEICQQFIINKDDKLGFIILYSYDYLYLTHKYICEYLDNGKFSNLLLEKIKQNLFNKD